MSNKINESLQAWFPPFKWLIGGLVAIVALCFTFVLDVKIDSAELRKELEIEKKLNSEQDIRIEKTYELMRSISVEQARIAQSMENLSRNMSETMKRVASDTSEIRRRVDRHIEEGKD